METRCAALSDALDRLTAIDPAIARAIAEVGAPEPRVLEPGFAALLRIIVGQQVSTASAEAIRTRLWDAGADDPERYLVLDDAALGAIGLSRAKIRYGRALAEAVVSGCLDPRALSRLSGAEADAALTALPGIGRWTSDIYRMFALGDMDVFPSGDLALREGVRLLDDAIDRPSPSDTDARALDWRPHRSAAALLLWRLYRVRRGVAVLGADTGS
ncbi:MAG: DNA-3-methyladenine glycosylase 2 family protein [Alphaproteobacteria bacterium]|nr:DNA-3-methyladenine glycosylase 2 family protein [Alphaproteobacteria bacterium]